MRRLTLAVAAGALLVATQANAGSFPVNKLTGAETDLVDQVAVRVYVHEGRRYCFYFDGWHGPGWYRCGFAWRQGIGWGGVYGWNSWSYGPYERRHHQHGNWQDHRRGDRVGVDSTRSRSSVESRTRTRTTTGAQSNTRVRSTTTGAQSNTRVRSTTTGAQSNTRVRSTTGQSNGGARSTTGRGGADVQSGGGAKMQGGGNATPSVGGNAGGGGGGGGEKK
jgi:hypothetical protein